MTRVLVTDGEQRSTLAVVRSLGRAGYHVEVAAASDRSMAGGSCYVAAEHRVSEPVHDPAAYASDIVALTVARSIDVLLPMTDVSAAVLLGERDRLGSVAIPFSSQSTWEDVTDKGRLMAVADEIGIPVPRQFVAEDRGGISEASAWGQREGYPVVLKPHRSAIVSTDRVHRLGVRIAEDESALVDGLQAFPDEAFPILVQQFVRGTGVGGFFLTVEGETVAHFGHRRLREKPPTGGVSVLRESVGLSEELLEYSEALLRLHEWSGVAMVEFREEANTGALYLMEINGRFWGSLQLAIDAGVDFPRLLLDRVGSANPSVEHEVATYTLGVRSRWLLGDLDHLLWIFRTPADRRAGYSNICSPPQALMRFLVPWRSAQRLEVLRFADLGPFLREVRLWIRSLRSS